MGLTSMGVETAELAVLSDDSERRTRAIFTAFLNLLLIQALSRGRETLDHQLLGLYEMNRNSYLVLIISVHLLLLTVQDLLVFVQWDKIGSLLLFFRHRRIQPYVHLLSPR